MLMAKKNPSQKQLQALALIGQGVQPSQAMRQVGYSELTSRNPKENLLESKAILTIVDEMKLQLNDMGVTAVFLAQKLGEFAKSNSPTTFFPAYDRLKEIVGIEKPKQEQQPIRKWEFTEWVNSDDNRSERTITEIKSEDSNLSSLTDLNAIKLNKYNELETEELEQEPTLIDGQPI